MKYFIRMFVLLNCQGLKTMRNRQEEIWVWYICIVFFCEVVHRNSVHNSGLHGRNTQRNSLNNLACFRRGWPLTWWLQSNCTQFGLPTYGIYCATDPWAKSSSEAPVIWGRRSIFGAQECTDSRPQWPLPWLIADLPSLHLCESTLPDTYERFCISWI